MALRAVTNIRSYFSHFKKKCRPLQQEHYDSFSHMYGELYEFESNLDALEVKKMDKKLLDFDKKFRKLWREDKKGAYAVPMEVSHTYEYFIKTADRFTFGNQELQIEATMDQMLEITRNMSKFSLNKYHSDLLPNVHNWSTLHKIIQLRFATLEQRLCRLLFYKYFNFSQMTSKLSFLSQREYKGQYKFDLVDNVEVFQQASEILMHCAQFNQLRSKLVLACQKVAHQYGEKLSGVALGRYLYCLAVAGRPVKTLEGKIFQILEKVKKQPINLLLYLAVSELEDHFILKKIIEQNHFSPGNMQELQLLNISAAIMKSKHDLIVPISSNAGLSVPYEKHGGELFFDSFLQRHQYTYFSNWNQQMGHHLFDIAGKKFISLDHRSILSQNNTINGFGILFKQYFSLTNTALKHINWPRMLTLPTRTQKDEYILSKFKGIPRPKIVKVRYYD